MSLQLILGGSGAGKSTYLYSSIIEESINNPDTDYIIIVPEQYTMQHRSVWLSFTHEREFLI